MLASCNSNSLKSRAPERGQLKRGVAGKQQAEAPMVLFPYLYGHEFCAPGETQDVVSSEVSAKHEMRYLRE